VGGIRGTDRSFGHTLQRSDRDSEEIQSPFWPARPRCRSFALTAAACSMRWRGCSARRHPPIRLPAQPSTVGVARLAGQVPGRLPGPAPSPLFRRPRGLPAPAPGLPPTAWPPLRDWPAHGGGGAMPRLLGTTSDLTASTVTYSGPRLKQQHFSGDQKAGTPRPGRTAFGASWFALTPTGTRHSAAHLESERRQCLLSDADQRLLGDRRDRRPTLAPSAQGLYRAECFATRCSTHGIHGPDGWLSLTLGVVVGGGAGRRHRRIHLHLWAAGTGTSPPFARSSSSGHCRCDHGGAPSSPGGGC